MFSEQQELHSLFGPLIVSLGYFIGAEAAFYIGTLSDNFFAPFWPPNVVLFCALAFVPYQRWWTYIAAVFPAHILVEWQVAMPPAQVIVAFATNCAVAIINATLIKELLIDPPWLDSFQRAVLYIIGTACVSPAVVAFGGAFVRIVTAGDLHAYWTYWMQWYAANALASLTLGPFFLVYFDRDTPGFVSSPRQGVEALLLAGLLMGTCALVFAAAAGSAFAGFVPALFCLPLPLVICAAVRFGVKGASAAILIVTVITIWMTLNGLTIFGHAEPEVAVLQVQVFLTGLAIPILLLGASIEGMQRAQRTIRELAQTLMWSHDEERRRTAKDLHEGICQELAAASLAASRMNNRLPEALRTNIQQLEQRLNKSIRGLRSASYLLHPPLLDESGLETALCSFVDGFACSTRINVELTMPPGLGRFSPDIEIAVFRFVQEALSDLGRRPEIRTAAVRAERCGPDVVVTIAEGDGDHEINHRSLLRKVFPDARAEQSVGFAGMRERLLRVGGELELEWGAGKPVLRAIVPACDQLAEQNV